VLNSLPRKISSVGRAPRSEHETNTDNRDRNNKTCSNPQTRVFHCLLLPQRTPRTKNISVFLNPVHSVAKSLFRFSADYRTLSHLEKRFLGTLNNKTCFLYLFDFPDDSAICDDFVIYL